MTLCSLKRNRRTIPDNANAIREDRERTKKRLYINIGNLPYSDGRTGIPRVAKKILEEGLKGRIITSSAKPEKRIVAHKASIIEIVKITIEGAHEPLLSSYSSGQSIYFGFNDFRQIPV